MQYVNRLMGRHTPTHHSLDHSHLREIVRKRVSLPAPIKARTQITLAFSSVLLLSGGWPARIGKVGTIKLGELLTLNDLGMSIIEKFFDGGSLIASCHK